MSRDNTLADDEEKSQSKSKRASVESVQPVTVTSSKTLDASDRQGDTTSKMKVDEGEVIKRFASNEAVGRFPSKIEDATKSDAWGRTGASEMEDAKKIDTDKSIIQVMSQIAQRCQFVCKAMSTPSKTIDVKSVAPVKTLKTGVFHRNLLKRTVSLEDIQFEPPGSNVPPVVMNHSEKLTQLSDVGCLSVRCSGHGLLALVDLDRKGLFLPFFRFNLGAQSIEAILEHFIHKVLFNQANAKLGTSHLTGVDRLQIPQSDEYVSRYFYELNVDAKAIPEALCMCKASHAIPLKWCSLDTDLKRERGFETIYFLKANSHSYKESSIHLSETSCQDVLDALQSTPHTKQLLECVGFERADLLALYNEFLHQFYPPTTASKQGLTIYLSKIVTNGTMHRSRARLLFKAFNGEKLVFFNFQNMLIALACVITQLNGRRRNCAHAKCQEAKNKMLDMTGGSESIDLEVDLEPIMLSQFKSSPGDRNRVIDKRGLTCQQCQRCDFHLATHSISLSEIGEVDSIASLDDGKRPGPRISFRNDLDESSIHILANDLINRIKNLGSFAFNPERLAQSSPALHNVIENWFFQSREEMVNYLKMIANKADRIFASEPRVMKVSSPVYVFGDIHGNLKDLLTYSELFWKQSPFLNKCSYVFLGDYVDRGLYGVECIIYLFCLKILAPRNYILLRGNHEIREIQDQFTFTFECSSRFSIDLWDVINNAFDNLPLVAVVDDQVFCAHGGIPVSVNTIEQLRAIPAALETPMSTSIEAWELLWNDPISDEEFLQLSDFETNFTIISRGFARNTKRGTAYMYTEGAVDNFFAQNGLSRLLRAHEVFEEGFRIHHTGNVFTVFSTSHYADLTNRASCFFLDHNLMRIIQMVQEDSTDHIHD